MPPKKSQAKITSSLKAVKPKISAVAPLKKQRDWEKEEQVLRCFDLDINYGPIIGISRRDRLARAEYFHLPVSQEVKDILKDPSLPPELNLNIWHDLENII